MWALLSHGIPDADGPAARWLESHASLLPRPVHLIKFKLTPEAFRKALLVGNGLRDCREAMWAVGFAEQLPSGAKRLVTPSEVKHVLEALQRSGEIDKLNLSHFICSSRWAQRVSLLGSMPLLLLLRGCAWCAHPVGARRTP